MHQNLNGLISKSDVLCVNIENLKKSGREIDILCITEHNMIDSDLLYLTIPNFTLATSCNRHNRNGGSCILVKNIHKYKVLQDLVSLSVPNVTECSAVELLNHNVVIICIYRPPKTTQNELSTFFNILHTIHYKLRNRKSTKAIFCGDFNIDLLKRTPSSLKLMHIISSFDMKIGTRNPTRPKSNSCIDNIFHNIRGSKCDVIDLGMSDHTAQLLKFPVKKTCTVNFWYTKRRDFSKENLTKFKECLMNLSFDDVYTTNDPEVAYNIFFEQYKLFYDLCFPIIKIKNTIIKKPKWLSKGISQCCRQKRKQLWKYRLSPSEDKKNALKQYSTRLKKIVKLTQKSQNNYILSNAENKSKATWKIINLNKTQFPKENINNIKVNNHTISDPRTIAEEFNNYYINLIKPINVLNNNNSSVADHFNNNNPNDPNINLTSFNNKLTLPSSSYKSLFLNPVIPCDINIIIKSLKNTRSTGYDDITTSSIKEVALVISPVLSHIFNLCIEQGVFPTKLKKSVVKPLFKKNNKEDMACYRPIALIPIFSKIFEKIIYNAINTHLEKFNLFAKEQKGFRKNKSINLAIYDLLKTVYTNIDKHVPVSAMFMDMTKAFDYVHHGTLLNKLYSYGIRGNVHKLLESYLNDRYQVVEIENINVLNNTEQKHKSMPKKVLYGVPQGSVLGPPLFLIYINDLPKVSQHPMILFADDSTAIFTGQNMDTFENTINSTLHNIINWLTVNNLIINLEKTKLVNFGRNNKNININIHHNGTKIEQVSCVKFLGLWIDNDLTWQTHIDTVCNKLNQYSYALYKLSKIVDQSVLLTAYHAYVSSTLRYAVIYWGNATNRDLVFKAQKRCIRAIAGIRVPDSCEPHFKEFKIMTFPAIYIYEVAVFIKTNENLFDKLKSRRYMLKISNVPHKTALFNKSFFGMASKIYNKIPIDILSTKEFPVFKNKLRKFLINKAYYTIQDFLNY